MSDTIETQNITLKTIEEQKQFPENCLRLDRELLRRTLDWDAVKSVVGDQIGLREERILDIALGLTNLVNLTITEKADTLVFLDKSARPIAELYKSYWRTAYPDVPLPEIRFLNIGREDNSKDNVSANLTKLKEIQIYKESIQDKNVLVVDETVGSGGSLKRSKKVLTEVFPEAKKYFFTKVLRDLPFWYKNPTLLGVYDLGGLPLDLPEEESKELLAEVSDDHITKSVRGIIDRKKNENKDWTKYAITDLDRRQKIINSFRNELAYLGRKIAVSSWPVSLQDQPSKSLLSEPLDKELNNF